MTTSTRSSNKAALLAGLKKEDESLAERLAPTEVPLAETLQNAEARAWPPAAAAVAAPAAPVASNGPAAEPENAASGKGRKARSLRVETPVAGKAGKRHEDVSAKAGTGAGGSEAAQAAGREAVPAAKAAGRAEKSSSTTGKAANRKKPALVAQRAQPAKGAGKKAGKSDEAVVQRGKAATGRRGKAKK